MIQFHVRFLQGGAVKRVVVRRGDPRLGEDFLPYRYFISDSRVGRQRTGCFMALEIYRRQHLNGLARTGVRK